MRPTPVKNIVSEIELTRTDVYLPIFELVINSIISIGQKYENELDKGLIKIDIKRSVVDEDSLLPPHIIQVKVTDNGKGFDDKNFQSFETPHSHTYKELGCKGLGRFTCLSAFKSMTIDSVFYENNKKQKRAFRFTLENEIETIDNPIDRDETETIVTIEKYRKANLEDASRAEPQDFIDALLDHCLIYYLNETLPIIEITDTNNSYKVVLNDQYKRLSKDREKKFEVKEREFKAYVIKTPKSGNRKNHYVHFCANSRQVGSPKSLASTNKLFSYPIHENGQKHFFDIYVVSDYLDEKNNPTRNGFNIPTGLFNDPSVISLSEIEFALGKELESQYSELYKKAQAKTVEKTQTYIKSKGLEYRRFLKRPEIMNAIPPFDSDKDIDEYLHKIAYKERLALDERFKKYESGEIIDFELVRQFEQDLKDKTVYDKDSLADYMVRRKSILKLFEKLLEADKAGKYKLEKDIHKLVMPMGISADPVDEAHNLWILDERFISYSFVASAKKISSFTDIKSSIEPDVLLWDENTDILDNPFAFGDTSSGEINSLVIFEFKRPGETAWQKAKRDQTWLYSDLIEKYFDEFLYNEEKNYKGRSVVIDKDTPKFGFIILDVIPKLLKEYNKNKGFNKTPYGTWYKIEPEINLHLEVITFEQLLQNAHKRHKPFFDKLFVG